MHPSFVSVALTKQPEKMQVRRGRERRYFSLRFQVTVHHGGEVKVRTANSWSHHIHSQEQREMKMCMCACLCSAPLLFCPGGPAPWSHPQRASSSHIN